MPKNHWTLLVSIFLVLLTADRASTQRAPSQVTDVSLSKAISQGRPSLRVTWTTPPSATPIFYYQVEHKRRGSTLYGSRHSITPPETSTHLPRLEAGTAYDVRVRAVSAAGEGEWSEVQTKKTFDFPSRVSDVSLTKILVSLAPALRVTWSTPQSDMAISQYQVEYRRNETTSWSNATGLSISSPANSTILTRLDVGTVYTVRVKAVSAVGDGNWSAEQAESTFHVPSRVSGVSLTKTVASGAPALRVAWTTPQSDLTISKYNVLHRRSGTFVWKSKITITGSPPVTSTILTELYAGIEYTVIVRAISVVGHGEWSIEHTERTFIDTLSGANGTDNCILQSGIIEAVCTCQLEVVLVAIVTGLVVHFVTKCAIRKKLNSSQDRSGNTAEPFGPVKEDDATYETVGGGDTTGENLEMQPSPAYQAVPGYM